MKFVLFRRLSLILLATFLGSALLAPLGHTAERTLPIGDRPPLPAGTPDLTRGEAPPPKERGQDWFLHCGKTRGWIYRNKAGKHDEARQILVTKVPVDSAVRSQLKVGDVILGANGKYFTRHAVFEFREASLPAKEKGGTFDVILWREGWTEDRILTLDLSYKPMDFTKGDVPGKAVDWNLGATGARGWMEGKDHETRLTRQILITSVEEGSPADGILQTGDVILGIGEQPFDSDARMAFGKALTQAETEVGRGKLRLLRWRAGKTETVTVVIPVLGSYSRTTPWDCPKSEKIVDAACEYLINSDVFSRKDILRPEPQVATLALMATGEPEHLEVATAQVKKLIDLAANSGKYPPISLYATWDWGYANLVLCEYYLLTGDKAALPAIRKFATFLAEGQSGVGSWGHRMAAPNHGPAPGYGAMNQAGTIAWMSLSLAKRCGVTDGEIEDAIGRGQNYLNSFIGKQPVSYGDHRTLTPRAHDDNGKSSAAAVAYAVLGDPQGTAFYSRMTVASHAVREEGHTGIWWSLLWGPLGAARAGEEACSAFLQELTWLNDLERRWDGGFIYQGKPGFGNGVDPETGRQLVYAEHTTPHWDTTGSRILMYCLPRQKLAITGKEVLAVAIPSGEIEDVLEAGRFTGLSRKEIHLKYDDLTTPEILAKLGSWSPVVRNQAAQSLAKKERVPLEQLIALLKGSDPYATYGAALALQWLGERGQGAVPALANRLATDDPMLRTYVISALTKMGGRAAIKPLLELATKEIPGDPYGLVQRDITRGLFRKGGLLEESIEGVDLAMLIPAADRILQCPGAEARLLIVNKVLDELTFEELAPLWPSMVAALRVTAPTNVMSGAGVRVGIATLLAKHKVEEGMELIFEYLRKQKGHGSANRNGILTDLLTQYGAAAKPLIPEMREYMKKAEVEYEWVDKSRPPIRDFYKKQVPHLQAAIEAIEASTETPELKSIKPYLK